MEINEYNHIRVTIVTVALNDANLTLFLPTRLFISLLGMLCYDLIDIK